MVFKNNPIVSLFAYTWRYATGCRRTFITFIFFSFCGNLLLLAEPYVIGRAFDVIQFSGSDPAALKKVISYFALTIVIVLLFWMFHGRSRIMERDVAYMVRKNFQLSMIDKVIELPVAWHKEHHSGDTIDKVNKATANLFEFAQNIFFIIQCFVGFVGSLAVLFIFDRLATVVAVGISGAIFAVIIIFDRYIVKGYKQIFKHENYLAAAVHDFISNILTVITLRLKGRMLAEIDKRALAAKKDFHKNNILNESKWFLANMLITTMTVLVLSINAYNNFRIKGVILAGSLVTLYGYLQGLSRTFFNFAWFWSEKVQEHTAVKAADVILDEYHKLVIKKEYHLPKKWQKLEIKNLHFHYQTNDNDKREHHLAGVNLNIGRGHKIAFIGESGSGKSTTLALLRGLYQPDSVMAFCDEQKLPAGLNHLTEQVTLMPQDPEVFNSSIEDNITMDTEVTPEELAWAMNLARFAHVPERLKNGLRTNVMEKGVSLSGGEKQRLALARGVLAARDSDIILMDEPTSSVDTATENEIYEKIFMEFADKTIISAMHRLHLLSRFDYVYMFKDGSIVAEGNFDSLMHNEIFSNLWHKYSKQHDKR